MFFGSKMSDQTLHRRSPSGARALVKLHVASIYTWSDYQWVETTEPVEELETKLHVGRAI